MSRIHHLPDFSQFIQSDEKIKIHNTVNFVVGEHFIEANGIVISQESTVLLSLAMKNSDIYLDDFVDNFTGVQDCIELLYGAKVQISSNNIQTIVKFSLKFEIKSLYQICLDWMKEQICTDNIYLLINTGFMVEKMLGDSQDILNICSNYIKDEIKDNLFDISRNWSFEDTSLIKFLIQVDILLFTLPILSGWVQNDNHIKLILDQVEMKDINEVLFSLGEKSTQLVEIMSDKVELFETSKRIIRLGLTGTSLKKPCLISIKIDLNNLISQDYLSFSLGHMLLVEEEFKLHHFEFIEFIVHWITHNLPSQNDFTPLWDRIRQQELCYKYVSHVRNTIQYPRGPERNSCRIRGINGKWTYYYTIPKVIDQGTTRYQYYCAQWYIKRDVPVLSSVQLESLLDKKTVVLNMECGRCKCPCDIKLKLHDKTPCYELDVNNTHCTVRHWYIEWYSFDDMLCYDEKAWCLYSLITNNCSSVIDKIKACMTKDERIGLYCLYQCDKR